MIGINVDTVVEIVCQMILLPHADNHHSDSSLSMLIPHFLPYGIGQISKTMENISYHMDIFTLVPNLMEMLLIHTH